MARIAIIDDNLEQSETLANAIEVYLKKLDSPIAVITQFPFQNISDYYDFINEKDVCLLILDERLNDQKGEDGKPVAYRGNELVMELRTRLKDFPIFAITNFPGDDDLEERRSEFENIIQREKYIADGLIYTPILIRAAQRYLESNQKELVEFENLTKEIAGGGKKRSSISRLKALQTKLELPFNGFDDRVLWLNEYEEIINSLEAFKSQLRKKIRSKK